ncbi:unnamed protein product [Didymodactylos carnosus]|uniref:TIR domain-containing protein n=1 Tax=Didymodactylos carnosus TaxID=1234261 RepID=A0A814DC97_9BILA|nr:unnamed protein product [Didymodactylos carnosus]CAF3729187.1 unnamed protein product [Didymodactylos carnosus]
MHNVLVQNDKIQVELVQKNGIPLLIDCACESKFDAMTIQQPSLENLLTMAFVPNAAEILINHPDFIQYVKQKLLTSSDNTELNVADGLMWKLKKEPEKLLKEKEHNSSENAGKKFEYDIMLSYSHIDMEMCDKIYNRLTNDKFKVWRDKVEMYGSYMDRMAEGVETSEFVVILMSDSYKKSQNCRAEAIYARENKRHIIPLKIQEDYKPNGWLGILVADLNYVNFALKNFNKSYEELITQFQLYRKPRKIDSKSDDVKPPESSHEEKRPKSYDIPTTADSSTIQDNFFEQRLIESWTEKDVRDFLTDKHLEVMIPSCRNMNGSQLYQMYKSCEKNNSDMFKQLNCQLERTKNKVLSHHDYYQFLSELKVFVPVITSKNSTVISSSCVII